MTVNDNLSGNMRKMHFYICPVCGNIITALGQGEFTCCGKALTSQEAVSSVDGHLIEMETIDNEYCITMQHPMTKEHYISFIAYVTAGTVEIAKLYPEQDISVRFRKKGHGMLYAYCNKHGMFRKVV